MTRLGAAVDPLDSPILEEMEGFKWEWLCWMNNHVRPTFRLASPKKTSKCVDISSYCQSNCHKNRVPPWISRMLSGAPFWNCPSRSALRKRGAALEFLDLAVLWSLPVLWWGQCLVQCKVARWDTLRYPCFLDDYIYGQYWYIKALMSTPG